MLPSNLMLRGYSCPHEQLDSGLLDQLASTHARETVRRFLRLHSERLRQYGEGITEILEEWLARETDFATVWDPAFSYCYAAILNPDVSDATNVGAALALRLAACGMRSQWTLELEDATARLRWDNWLLPEGNRITLRSDGQSAEIQGNAQNAFLVVRLSRTGSGWICDGAERLPTFGRDGTPITLLSKHALGVRDGYQLPTEVETHIDPGFVNACQCAIELMGKYAPTYLAWVTRAVRHIVVLQRQNEGDYNYSGSSSGDYGLIHACASPDPVGLAEILVHEAAHQYYYILGRLGPVDDGTDQNAYYSPLVKTVRRIDRILLAYHAVGNIILLARQLRDSGAPQSATFSEQQENKLFEELRQLEEPLRGNSALTPIGRAILDPLMEHVHRGS